jgi:hypothetical protein
LTDINDKFTVVVFMLLRPHEKSGLILSMSNGNLELYFEILSFYLDTVILLFDQR